MKSLQLIEILLKEKMKQKKVKSFDQSLKNFGITLMTEKSCSKS